MRKNTVGLFGLMVMVAFVPLPLPDTSNQVFDAAVSKSHTQGVGLALQLIQPR